jgi:hypothetical protein
MTTKNTNEIYAAGTLTYNDYKKHNSYHIKKMVIGYFFFAFFILICMGLLRVSGPLYLIIPFISVIAGIIAGSITLLLAIGIRIRGRKEFKSDTLITNEIKYTINNNGINQEINSKSNAFIKWEEILKGYEHGNMLRLYISRNKAIILPKRFFRSNDDLITFKKIIRNNLNKAKLIQ